MKNVHQNIATIGINSYVAPETIFGKDVKLGANCAVLSRINENDEIRPVVIGDSAAIGALSVIYPGVVIGERAVVHPGSVVTRSVPPLAIVSGNPATIHGYVSTLTNHNQVTGDQNASDGRMTRVKGVALKKLKVVPDLRGSLTVGDFEKEIPFNPKRYFMVFDVPTAETRGEHAHHQCHQFLLCIKGSCNVVADDGQNREEYILNSINTGLYLPPMTWGIQYKYSPDAVLLVFASHYYDPADYIRDYNEFLELAGAAQ